jgi:hypothetical protein
MSESIKLSVFLIRYGKKLFSGLSVNPELHIWTRQFYLFLHWWEELRRGPWPERAVHGCAAAVWTRGFHFSVMCIRIRIRMLVVPYGSVDPDSYLNVTDPQHCLLQFLHPLWGTLRLMFFRVSIVTNMELGYNFFDKVFATYAKVSFITSMGDY